jgi:hypothetical protein
VAQLHQAEADAGFVTPFILLALAAVALGGTSMTGGRGSLLGALLGAAVIFLIENLLGALGLSSFWSQAVYGATLIAAVVFAALSVSRARTASRDNSSKRSRRDYGGYFPTPGGRKVSTIPAGRAPLPDNSNKRASATRAGESCGGTGGTDPEGKEAGK